MKPILTLADYLALPRNPETWLVEPLLPAGGKVLLYGDPKTGKSYLAFQLALALTEGKDFLGFPVKQKARVVYVQLDTPRSLWASRLDALKLTPELKNRILQADLETLECFPFDILNPLHHDLLKTSLDDLHPDVVIIDTLREISNVSENDSDTMKQVVSSLESATRPAAVVLVHHAKKPNENNPSVIHDSRGSGYLTGRMDTILKLTHKALYFTGRSVEEGSIKLQREDDGMWTVNQDEIEVHIESVMLDPDLKSTRQRAIKLAQLIGKSESASRALLRRRLAQEGWSK